MMIKTSNLPSCPIEVWRLRSRVKYMRSLGWFPKLKDQAPPLVVTNHNAHAATATPTTSEGRRRQRQSPSATSPAGTKLPEPLLFLVSSSCARDRSCADPPSRPRGLTCRRPPSAVPAAAAIRSSAPFAPILFCTKERHARTLQLATAMPATVIGFESASPHQGRRRRQRQRQRQRRPPQTLTARTQRRSTFTLPLSGSTRAALATPRVAAISVQGSEPPAAFVYCFSLLIGCD
ncbi:hypothetical protein DEO72_LG2g4351 [Vigna unguiculata]|uniref:Uncharacterized protein n=1 Tax=Vigna unguiculata TaxID=3917 RepID=A0A4D6L666_VIGUN|nr:hypothetical protein DEO72_LG2g4351 [Vigna unguiculata]